MVDPELTARDVLTTATDGDVDARRLASRSTCATTRPGSRRDRLANRVSDPRRDSDAAKCLVDAFDDDPGRLNGAGAPERALGGRHELVIHLPVLPLALGHAPPGQLILLERPQPFLLFALPEVHPELEDEGAAVGQVALERGNSRQLPIELRDADSAVDAIEDGTRIPRAGEQPDATAWRQVAPVPPVLRPLALLVGGLMVGARHDPARVHPGVQEVDGLARTRAVDAGEDDNQRELRRRQLSLDFEQLRAKDRNLLLERILLDRAPEFGSFEHASPHMAREPGFRIDGLVVIEPDSGRRGTLRALASRGRSPARPSESSCRPLAPSPHA